MSAISPPDELQQKPQERDSAHAQGNLLHSEDTNSKRRNEWSALRSRDGWLGLGAAVALLILSVTARVYSAGRTVDGETFMATIAGLATLVLAVLVAGLSYGYYSLRYQLAPKMLTINWLWMQEKIPLANVEAILKGTRLGDKAQVNGVVWRGYRIGTTKADEIGALKFFGTSRDPSAAIILATVEGTYALTPSDLQGFRDRLIELLESIPEGNSASSAEPHTQSRYLSLISPFEIRRAVLWLAGIAVGATILWGILQIPAELPDTSSPLAHTAVGTVNDWTSVGQTFVPRENGLHRISVVLATDRATDSASIVFNIKETPTGPPLRIVKKTISELPEGNPSDLRPDNITEGWFSFNFDPIPDSAGRKLYFSLEGKDVPEANTVKVLMFYHSQYPQGEAYLNEKAVDAHVPFRAYSQGQLGHLITVLLGHLARTKPAWFPTTPLVLALTVLYLLLAFRVLKSFRASASS